MAKTLVAYFSASGVTAGIAEACTWRKGYRGEEIPKFGKCI